MCVRIYILNFKNIKTKKTTKKRIQKANETAEEERISVENLTGYDDIVCKFVLCNFNLT